MRWLFTLLLILIASPSWATIPTWSCVATNDADGTDGVTLNVGSPSAGQLVVVVATADGAHTSITTPTDFTVLQASTDHGSLVTASFYKFATGSEGATVSVGALGGAADDSEWIACKFTGAHASTAPETGTVATATDANPDPPSLNPAGWDTEDTLWIVFIGEAASQTLNTPPSGFGNTESQLGGGANAGTFLTFRTATTQIASIDPGTGTLSASTSWGANTIAVRPSVPNTSAHSFVSNGGPLIPFVNGGLVN